MTEVSLGTPASPEGAQYRGHHFVNLVDAEVMGSEHVANSIVTQLRTIRGSHTSHTVDLPSLEQGMRYDATYAVDVIGDRARQTFDCFDKLDVALGQLSLLPNEATVTFDTKPDAICGSCAFGHHCKRPGIADSDILSIDTLVWVSDGLGVKDQVAVSGSKEDGSYKMVTTAGVVRSMMKLFQAAEPDDPSRAFKQSRDNPYYEPFKVASTRGHRNYRWHARPADSKHFDLPIPDVQIPDIQ